MHELEPGTAPDHAGQLRDGLFETAALEPGLVEGYFTAHLGDGWEGRLAAPDLGDGHGGELAAAGGVFWDGDVVEAGEGVWVGEGEDVLVEVWLRGDLQCVSSCCCRVLERHGVAQQIEAGVISGTRHYGIDVLQHAPILHLNPLPTHNPPDPIRGPHPAVPKRRHQVVVDEQRHGVTGISQIRLQPVLGLDRAPGPLHRRAEHAVGEPRAQPREVLVDPVAHAGGLPRDDLVEALAVDGAGEDDGAAAVGEVDGRRVGGEFLGVLVDIVIDKGWKR